MVRIAGKSVMGARAVRTSGAVGRAGKSSRQGAASAASATATAGGFARSMGVALDSEGEGLAAVSSVSVSAEQLLSIQESRGSGDREESKRAIFYGEGLLSRLEGLHVRLLSGGVAEEDLRRLSAFFAADRVVPREARLREILAEIELRVEVEIAKRESARKHTHYA